MRCSRFAISVLTLLAACNGQLDHVGRPPSMTPPGAPDPQVAPVAPERVAMAPPPPGPQVPASAGSLWASGPGSLFGDRRARGLGDILTVVVSINDEAAIDNSTLRSRSGSEEASVGTAFGLETLVEDLLPGDGSLSPAVDASGSSASSGTGSVSRTEEIELRLAATVVDVLPNGHLVIAGSQEVRVNFELRDLQVAGIVRPEDISRQNEITYDKIADARILYGGRGQITDLQQPRYGQQVIDVISPF